MENRAQVLHEMIVFFKNISNSISAATWSFTTLAHLCQEVGSISPQSKKATEVMFTIAEARDSRQYGIQSSLSVSFLLILHIFGALSYHVKLLPFWKPENYRDQRQRPETQTPLLSCFLARDPCFPFCRENQVDQMFFPHLMSGTHK